MPIDQREAGSHALLTPLPQQLHAETNAQDRDAVLCDAFPQGRDQTACVQRLHAVIECADAGQDNLLGLLDVPGRDSSDSGRSDLPQHAEDRSKVPNTVRNDRYHGAYLRGDVISKAPQERLERVDAEEVTTIQVTPPRHKLCVRPP